MTAAARVEADRAMAALRQAVASGSHDAHKIRTDTDLGLLYPRSDFRLLLMDLAMPADPFARRD